MAVEKQSPAYTGAASVNPDVVKAELARVLSSHEFSETPRLQEFLHYVVEETLEGREARIKGFTIAHDVFHREDPDDAQATPIVRVEAGRLRRRLDDYYEREGQRDPIRIRIPKGAYVPQFESVAGENVAGETGPAARTGGLWSRRGLPLATFSLAAAVVAVVALLWLFRAPATELDVAVEPFIAERLKPAIAVLPFEDTTSDAAGASIAAGLTEDIVTDLSNVSSIDVIALSSVLPYRDRDITPQAMAAELSVSHILRGSIRGTDAQLRVTAQLFEADTGRQIWAKRFDRNPADELALQRDLALSVVEGMAVSLQGEQLDRLQKNTPIRDHEALSLYKQALNLANPPSDPRRLRVAGRVFQEVIEAAPEFAGGYAGTAYTHAFLAWWGHSTSPEEDVAKAFSHAEKALEIDPDFGLAHSALAFAHLTAGDFDQALAASWEAVQAQPNDPYVSSYHGFLLNASGHPEEGIPFAQRAIRLDPVFPRTPFRNILGVIYFHSGQYQDALDAFQRSRELGGPRSPGLLAYEAASYAILGRSSEARTAFDLLNEYNGGFDWRDWLRRAYKNEQDVERVLRPLRELANG